MEFIKIIALIFFINFLLIKSSELSEIGKHLTFNLKEEKKDIQYLSESDYMKERMYHKFYSKINVGIPVQNLKFFFETNIYEIIISEDEYDKIRSSSYKLKNGNLSQDKFEFAEDIVIDNFTFFLKNKSKSENEKNINIIGLSLSNNKFDSDSLSFLNQLKQNNYIDKKIFSFIFDDYIIREKRGICGQLLIGCMPHEVINIYEEKDLKWISASEDNNNNIAPRKWHINFDTVKYNNDELDDKLAVFDLSLNLIIGPESFRKKLVEEFFKTQIEKNICKEEYFYNLEDEQFYLFYSCSMNAEFIEIPNLSFYNKELNEMFNISFYGLFVNYRHRFYFNIIFNKKPQDNWVFGQLFFKSYRFVFDLERERIGYYKTYEKKEHPMVAIFILIIVLLIILFSYLFYINKKDSENLFVQKQMNYPIRNEYIEDNNNKKENNNKINEKEKQN